MNTKDSGSGDKSHEVNKIDLSTSVFGLSVTGTKAIAACLAVAVIGGSAFGYMHFANKEFETQKKALFATHSKTLEVINSWNQVLGISSNRTEDTAVFVRDNLLEVISRYDGLSIDHLKPMHLAYFYRHYAILKVIEADYYSDNKDDFDKAILALAEAKKANDSAESTVRGTSDPAAQDYFSKEKMLHQIKLTNLNINALKYHVSSLKSDKDELNASLAKLGSCKGVLDKGFLHQKLLEAMECLDEFNQRLARTSVN